MIYGLKLISFRLNFKQTMHYVLLIGVRKLISVHLYYSVSPTSSMIDSERDKGNFYCLSATAYILEIV